MKLDIRKILAILPHRFPFILVDRIDELVPNQHIRGFKNVSINEPFFAGHFPGDPILPGMLVVEALAQVGALLTYASDPFDAQQFQLYFLSIERMKFKHAVRPGDRLDLEMRVVGHNSNVWKLRGEATVAGTLCAEGTLVASVVERER